MANLHQFCAESIVLTLGWGRNNLSINTTVAQKNQSKWSTVASKNDNFTSTRWYSYHLTASFIRESGKNIFQFHVACVPFSQTHIILIWFIVLIWYTISQDDWLHLASVPRLAFDNCIFLFRRSNREQNSLTQKKNGWLCALAAPIELTDSLASS